MSHEQQPASADWLGAGAFIAAVLGITYLAVFGSMAAGTFEGRPSLWFQGVAALFFLCIPGLTAFLVAALFNDEAHPVLKIRPVPPALWLGAIAGLPLLFAAIWFTSDLLGLATRDASLDDFKRAMGRDASIGFLPSSALFSFGLALTIILGPSLGAALVAMTECGWRGYLLPKLLPLGRIPAYSVTGIAWGLSIVPAFYAADPSANLAATVLMPLLLALVLAFVLGEIWRRTRSFGATTIFLGCFLMHFGGVWRFLFPDSNHYLAGPEGLIGLGFLAALALFLYTRGEKVEQDAVEIMA